MKLKYEERWSNIFKDFENHYSHLAERVEEMYPVGYKEVIFITSAGEKICYNFFDKTFRFVNSEQTKSNQDETGWRDMFSEVLNKKMRLCGYTLEELSDETDISMVTLWKYTNGTSTPSAYNLKRLANALNCSVDELMYEYETPDVI